MDYCWGPVEVDDIINLKDEIPQDGVFKHIYKYINSLSFAKKIILLLKSATNVTESQINIQTFSLEIDGVYLSSFLTRKFINFASEYSLSVISQDFDFPFIIHNSLLKLKLTKEQFERLGLVAKRGSFRENKPFTLPLNSITKNVEMRYQSLLGPQRTNSRNVIIVSRKEIDQDICKMLNDIINVNNTQLKFTDYKITRIKPFSLKSFLGKDNQIDIDNQKNITQKRDREEYIPVESECNEYKMITKYQNEIRDYFKHENMFRKVHFTIKRNLISEKFDPWQVIQDLESAKIKNIWESALYDESKHYQDLEILLIDIGKLIIEDSKNHNDSDLRNDDGFVYSKVVLDGIMSFRHIVHILKFACINSKTEDDGTVFIMTLVGLNQFKDNTTSINDGDMCHLVCQKNNEKVYFMGINIK